MSEGARPRRKRGERPTWGRDIRRARVALELTQEQLGRRMGMSGGGQAICRWEGNHSRPRPRQRDALLAAMGALNPAVAAQLAAVFAAKSGSPGEPSTSAARATEMRRAATPNESPVPSPSVQPAADIALELALLRMADELDVPARRLRASALHFLEALRAARIGIDDVHARVAAWTARTE